MELLNVTWLCELNFNEIWSEKSWTKKNE